MKWFINFLFASLHRHPLWIIGTVSAVAIVFVLYNFTILAEQINQETTQQHAACFVESLDITRKFYSSDITSRVPLDEVTVSHDYLDHENSIPNPATFTIKLGNIISSKTDISARLYSDYPFPGRKNGGLKDRFEGEAIGFFRSGQGNTFWNIENVNGIASLRFAKAIKMEESCVACHNTHPQSPRKDWKIGDVRGVQSATFPMLNAMEVARQGLIQTSVAMIALILLGLFILILVLTRLRQTNSAISRFVPSQFLKLIGKQDITQVQLGDYITTEMTVLFADIRSFTTLSESMLPSENFDFINCYLALMEPIIQEHHGFIDKYMGDAIMALFREPKHAVAAGIKMLNQLEQANRDDVFDGKSIKIGVGVNTGVLMLGTVGGSNRMEGTVIGDTVNVAARLENMTKKHGAILVSQATAERVPDCKKRSVGNITLKGCSEEIKVYEILWKDAESN